jgi:hypothetical protein
VTDGDWVDRSDSGLDSKATAHPGQYREAVTRNAKMPVFEGSKINLPPVLPAAATALADRAY